MRCPLIVGRADEVAALREAVDAARRGSGATVFLVGEAGVGKSRQAAHLAGYADEQSLLVLRGRAVDGPHPVTFRPLTEALLAAMRDSSLPNETELDRFGPALGRLLPGRPDAATEVSLIAVAEGVLRLLGRAWGCLLVLEDLHWADPETVAVLEYLADHCAGERLAVVATVRAELPCRPSSSRPHWTLGDPRGKSRCPGCPTPTCTAWRARARAPRSCRPRWTRSSPGAPAPGGAR